MNLTHIYCKIINLPCTKFMRKFLIIGLTALATLAAADNDCPEDKQVICVDDVRAAYEPCKKAAESGGSDLPATLQCLKYYSKMRNDCWPCICMVAKDEGFDIKGCDWKRISINTFL